MHTYIHAYIHTYIHTHDNIDCPIYDFVSNYCL